MRGVIILKKSAILLSMMLVFSLFTFTACGTGNNTNGAVDNGTTVEENTNGGVVNDVKDGVEDMGDAVEDGAEDLVNGTENLVNGNDRNTTDNTNNMNNTTDRTQENSTTKQ